MRKLLAVLLAVAAFAGIAHAADPYPVTYMYDLDSTTYVCPVLCTGNVSASSPMSCPGNGVAVTRPATTSGSSSATVTSVNSDAPFNGLANGDVIVFNLTSGPAIRRVLNVVSTDSITVDSVITIPAAGASFVWFKTVTGTGATDDGYFSTPGSTWKVTLGVDQISVVGGIDYKVECRECVLGRCGLPEIVAGPTNVTATGAPRVAFLDEKRAQCRACFKIGTSDANDNVVITAGANDDIDFEEDPAGVPKACVATLTAGIYSSGTTLCTEVAAQMNAAVCAPDNTYSCSFSASTGKITIARATGAKAFDMGWITGPNAATSAAAALGYTADDTGATSYLADAALDFGDPASETEKLTVTIQPVR